MQPSAPIVKHLVLIGGGHSHLAVLKQFGMKPVPGLAITLISKEIEAPYSGAMPAYLSGQYHRRQMHIDLRPLAIFAGARLIHQEVTRIDRDAQRVYLNDRPPIDYDLLSINTGSHPDPSLIEGAAEFAIPVKPIDTFLKHWHDIHQAIQNRQQHGGPAYHVAIVGGGPAGVELALATMHRLQKDLALSSGDSRHYKLSIISSDDSVLMAHNESVRQRASDALAKCHVDLLLGAKARRITAAGLELADERFIAADKVIAATGASLPEWLAESGLQLAEDGFVQVKATLQTSSDDNVFVAGDAATVIDQPRPKSGVYAVRQGKVLAENLRRHATHKRLKKYYPQKQALALLNLGNGHALASRGNFAWQGRLVWQWKDAIDKAFVRKYTELPAMQTKSAIAPGLLSRKESKQFAEHALRCAGCGAKVASHILRESLDELQSSGVGAGVPNTMEDAALTPMPDGQVLVQSIDYLRGFLNDPYLFARIATNHSLNDIYAMGVMPDSALALVGIPHASSKFTRTVLSELMQGCAAELAAHDCQLTGGHSAEIAELCFGLSVSGFANDEQLLRKNGMQDGDQLILTKPLGTGTLLAADMRYRASHAWIHHATAQMLVSNRLAAEIFGRFGANACTDITGFGLAGHLQEMLAGTQLSAQLTIADIPVLEGAQETLAEGIISSLHDDNALAVSHLMHTGTHSPSHYAILFDPQTAGGLLASVPAAQVADCLSALQQAGYSHARSIGHVKTDARSEARILLN